MEGSNLEVDNFRTATDNVGSANQFALINSLDVYSQAPMRLAHHTISPSDTERSNSTFVRLADNGDLSSIARNVYTAPREQVNDFMLALDAHGMKGYWKAYTDANGNAFNRFAIDIYNNVNTANDATTHKQRTIHLLPDGNIYAFDFNQSGTPGRGVTAQDLNQIRSDFARAHFMVRWRGNALNLGA